MPMFPYRDPIAWFAHWFEEAADGELVEPNAMTLSTVGADGQPTARVVLLKDYGPDGFVFYTNYRSRKARQIAHNPRVCLSFYWRELYRQVRIEGVAERVPAAVSDAYFASRARGSQIGAWASLQSEPLEAAEAIAERLAELEARFAGGEVPRPAHWGGYSVAPTLIEFWSGGADRLHDRWRFMRDDPRDDWSTCMLYP